MRDNARETAIRVFMPFGGNMAERPFTEELLYDLVWRQPLRNLSERFGISDVALRKCCERTAIPTPERRYWARKVAGRPTFVPVSRTTFPQWRTK